MYVFVYTHASIYIYVYVCLCVLTLFSMQNIGIANPAMKLLALHLFTIEDLSTLLKSRHHCNEHYQVSSFYSVISLSLNPSRPHHALRHLPGIALGSKTSMYSARLNWLACVLCVGIHFFRHLSQVNGNLKAAVRRLAARLTLWLSARSSGR